MPPPKRPKLPKITKALVDRAMAGDRAAMYELVNLLTPAIRWKIVRVLLLALRTCEQDIKEVTATTLMALIVEDGGKLIRAWEPSRRSFEAYARLIAKQKAIEFLRKRRKESPDGLDGLEPEAGRHCSPEEHVSANELGQKALETLKSELSPLGRQFMVLLILEERTTGDVCAIMNMKANAVDQWRRRLLTRFERILVLLGGER